MMKMTIACLLVGIFAAGASSSMLTFDDSDGKDCTFTKSGNDVTLSETCAFKSTNILNKFDEIDSTLADHTQGFIDIWQAHNNLVDFVDQINVQNSCHDHAQRGERSNGDYVITVGGAKVTVYCYFFKTGEDWTGLDAYRVTGGATTYRRTDSNSCPVGMNIWVPRSKGHMASMIAKFGSPSSGSPTELAGIYRPSNGCGGCTSHAMHSSGDSDQGAHGWTSVAPQPNPWFLRDIPYAEPNGDYTANCWLKQTAHDGSGAKFNDGNCIYGFSNYLCSTNHYHMPPSADSCTEVCSRQGDCTDGMKWVNIGGAVKEVFCTFENGYGFDAQIATGSETRRSTDANSCPSGTNIWVPRSKSVQEAVFRKFGSAADITGVYKNSNGCGGCTSHAMKSGGTQTAHGWTSVASPATPWHLRDAAYSEPNGDYHANCWLSTYSSADEGSYDNQGTKFNDGNCNAVASQYLCSTNPAWPVTH
jgi:hypothetical protein